MLQTFVLIYQIISNKYSDVNSFEEKIEQIFGIYVCILDFFML